MALSSLCVFCGANSGADPGFAESARALGRLLGSRGITLIYGGGSVGLMGLLADAAMKAGGRAVGVIPHALWQKDVGHSGLSELHVVDTMHQRKAMMADLADAFVVLPGGIGTLEEFFEVWTWSQLGIYAKPIGVLDVKGYFNGLFTFIDAMVAQGFLGQKHRDMVQVAACPAALVDALEVYKPPLTTRWLQKTQA